MTGYPRIWTVRDERCGHDFSATRAEPGVLQVLLEVGGPLFPGALRIHEVDDPEDYRPKDRDCEVCNDRQKQLLVAVFRPALRQWAEDNLLDPAAAIQAYDGLIDEGHSPHAAAHAVQRVGAMGKLPPVAFDVPDLSDPRWLA